MRAYIDKIGSTSSTRITESRGCSVIQRNWQQQHEKRVEFFNISTLVSVYRMEFFEDFVKWADRNGKLK